MRSILALLALVAMTARSRPAPIDSGYEPRPDRTLFRESAAVEGIEKADLWFSTAVTNSGYRGRLQVADGVTREEAARDISTVYAILRQGRFQQSITRDVVQGRRVVQFLPRVPSNGTTAELNEIYGPQPGDGKPPS